MPAVYLIHFSANYKHAKHYCGWTPNGVMDRLSLHRKGQGSRLCQVVTDAGIELELARVWKFKTDKEARDKERSLKKSGGLKRVCPICKKGGKDAIKDSQKGSK